MSAEASIPDEWISFTFLRLIYFIFFLDEADRFNLKVFISLSVNDPDLLYQHGKRLMREVCGW